MGNVADHPERLGPLNDAFRRREIAVGVDDGGQLVLVRPRSVLVDLGDTPTTSRRRNAAVRKAGLRQASRAQQEGPRRSGVAIVEVDNEVVEIHNELRWGVAPVQRALDALRNQGLDAEPNYVVLGSQTVRASGVGAEAHFIGGMMFTAEVVDSPIGKVLKATSEPAPAPDPASLPQPLKLRDRDAPRILILDSGLRTTGENTTRVAEHDYLKPVRIHASWVDRSDPGAVDDEDEYDDDGSLTLDFEAGHGTFIAGVIHQICPDAEIHVAGVLSSFGEGDVGNVLAAFESALARPEIGAADVDLVVLSFGCYMADDDASLFERGLRRLLGRSLAVSAAGNQSTSRRYFPAAINGVVAVGGLGQNEKAWFTNFGGWVDACAPAIDVISTFFMPNPNSGLNEPPFTGWARCSGTSFAAPKVAAAIAQEMYLNQTDAATAWKRLSDFRRYRYPDLGTVFNI